MAICCLSSDYEFPVVLSSVFSACSELAEARKPDTRVLAESSLRLFESLRLLESHFGVDVVTPPEQLTLLYNSIFDKFDCDESKSATKIPKAVQRRSIGSESFSHACLFKIRASTAKIRAANACLSKIRAATVKI
ncbi:hypothetical protein V6N11_011540 [Hibiscus sabdariffa]|uniref:Uncharacterized protein n=1 Tax=Hibiscus sabdariffa TaxID=183260 RepID=A0ABR2S8U5_9ROSI